MNLDSTSSAGPGPPPNPRASRGQIAAQACETCRSRKQKCDEQRPKCGLCQRMMLECRYREPQPTKKDKTLVEILDKLKIIESKVDRIPNITSDLRPSTLTTSSLGSLQPSLSGPMSFNTDLETSPYFTSILGSPGGTSQNQQQLYRQASAAHKILIWPAIHQLLLTLPTTMKIDLKRVEQDGYVFVVQLQKGMVPLPLDGALQGRAFVGMQSQATRVAGGSRTTFPSLTRDEMYRLTTAYFDTFNALYPFMDRQIFISDTLTRVYTEGFDSDTDSVIALLVFALGELAIDEALGTMASAYQRRDSREGSIIKPPGLALFNEARKRIGFVLTDSELENVQIYSLSALYCQACSRYVEFCWLMVAASSACRLLITCHQINWDSSHGELIKRIYWHCAMMETGLYLELDLPPTGLLNLNDLVGLPKFNTPFGEADDRGNVSSHFQQHYASQVALQRLCLNLHNISTPDSSVSSDASIDTGPTTAILNQLSLHLKQWRRLLPVGLQWEEEEPMVFPARHAGIVGVYNQTLDPSLAQQQQPSVPVFSPDLNSEPLSFPCIYDIQLALLRTRYYYARYMVHRPFIYKALHFPEQVTDDDAKGAAECLRSCLKWPLTLKPTSSRKRLIPYLFCWSQIFMSVLIVIHMTEKNSALQKIRAQYCGARFEEELNDSVRLMIEWISDLRSCDPIACWCYKKFITQWKRKQKICDIGARNQLQANDTASRNQCNEIGDRGRDRGRGSRLVLERRRVRECVDFYDIKLKKAPEQ